MKDIFLLVLALFIYTNHCAAGSDKIKPSENPVRLAPAIEQQAKLFTQINSAHSAQVLRSISHTKIQEDGHWQYSQYISIKIHDLDAARDYGRISFPFNHYYSDAQLDFANVRSSDGTITPVSQDAIQLRVTGGGQDFYSDSSEYVFSLPDVAPGSIIEFQLSLKSKILAVPGLFSERISPYWFQQKVGRDGWRVDHVAQHTYSLEHPADKDFYTLTYQKYPNKPKIVKHGNTTTKIWKMKDIKALTSEGWMPQIRHVAPQLFVSSHRDWQIIDRWTWANAKDKILPTTKLREIVSSFNLKKNATTEEKTRAVYKYLQDNVRYVFAHLGRGGYEPHFAEQVVDASYGDCKDQTILGIALLRLLGVNAYPALVETPRAGDADTRLVSMIFDHMIIYVAKGHDNQALWIDTTGDRSLYPGMSNYLYKQNAFIVNGQGGKLTRIEEGFFDNSVTLTLDYKQNQEGSTVANATIDLTGYFEQNMRSWWIHDNNRESELEKFLKSLFSNVQGVKYTGKLENAENLWFPVSLSAKFVFPKEEDPTTPPTYGSSFQQIFQLFGQLKDLQTPETRKQRFVDKYPVSLRVIANMHAEKNTIPTVVQSSGDVLSEYAKIEQRGQSTEFGYSTQFHFHKPALDLNSNEYEKYYRSLEKISLVKPWIISMQEDSEKNGREKIAHYKAQNGEDSIEYIVALARNQIESGLFEKALENAKKAVEIDSSSGEAWYLLGMAQGFNTLIEESAASFKRAETLGYLP